jgi:crossover junction endodeoxyribonuclease RuvC
VVVLGIDPGTRFTGYGVLRKEGSKSFLIDHGCLRLGSNRPLVERVGLFHDFFDENIPKWAITHCAIETSFMGKNAQNFLKLGYLRGIMYRLAYKYDLELLEYAPREVKVAVTGYGGASKDQVERVVRRLFPQATIEKQDVSDALAVMLCGLWKGSLNRLPKGI